MKKEQIIDELKKYLIHNPYRDTYVIKGENLPFLAESIEELFSIYDVLGQSELLSHPYISNTEYDRLMKALYPKDNSKR